RHAGEATPKRESLIVHKYVRLLNTQYVGDLDPHTAFVWSLVPVRWRRFYKSRVTCSILQLEIGANKKIRATRIGWRRPEIRPESCLICFFKPWFIDVDIVNTNPNWMTIKISLG